MLIKNKIIFWMLTIGLLLFSSIHFETAVKDDKAAFFGDTGDGLFNIWILEHNYQNVKQGNLNLFDGRIFQPEGGEDTLLWSDNLFVPTLFYIPLRFVTNSLTASYYTGILLSFIGYLSYLLLFYLIFRIINDYYKKLPNCILLLVPFFAYVSNFSISKFEYFVHFQNLSVCFSTILFACILGYFFYDKRSFFAGMLFSEVALLYSTPYFAVLGMCFILCWFIIQVTIDWKKIFSTIKENVISILISGVLFSFLAYHYMKVDKLEYQGYVYRLSRAHFEEFFVSHVGLFKSLFSGLGIKDNPESPTYLGMGLVLGIITILVLALPYIWKYLKDNYRNYKLYVLVAVIIIYRSFFLHMRDNSFVAAFGFVLVFVSLVFIFSQLINRKDKHSLRNMFVLLLLGATFCYGIAFGPSKYFLDNSLNPSLWGIITRIIPGASSMRAIGRMCVPGQGLLFAIVLSTILIIVANSSLNVKRIVLASVVLCLGLQIAEAFVIKANVTYRYPDMTAYDKEEVEFFDSHCGQYLLMPVTPWHRNSRGMIYFTKFMDITLMNGYSAKSTELWNQIMLVAPDNHTISNQTINIAVNNKCDYILIQKNRIQKYSYRRHVKPLNMTVVFNNDRFVVMETK